MISTSQRPLTDHTQHSQQTNIHAPSGIRTHDRSRRAAVGLRLRSRGFWDRHIYMYIYIYINTHTHTHTLSRVSFYDDSLLDPCQVGIVVQHYRKSSVLSLLSAFLALFRFAIVSFFSVLVQFFLVGCNFSTHQVLQKNRLSSFAKWSEKNKEYCNFRD